MNLLNLLGHSPKSVNTNVCLVFMITFFSNKFTIGIVSLAKIGSLVFYGVGSSTETRAPKCYQ